MHRIKILLPFLILSSLFSSSASTLYKSKCKSCHGAKADQRAMGRSKVISEMSVSNIKKAIYEYSSGKRKTLSFIVKAKKHVVKYHSKKELHDLATYIHSL